LSIATLLSLALRQGRDFSHQGMIRALLGKSNLSTSCIENVG
jgi:hypothetical protein